MIIVWYLELIAVSTTRHTFGVESASTHKVSGNPPIPGKARMHHRSTKYSMNMFYAIDEGRHSRSGDTPYEYITLRVMAMRRIQYYNYIYPELAIMNYRFRSGKGAGLEYRGSRY